MVEQGSWIDRNIIHFGRPPTPYIRENFQIESDRPISGRIEVFTGHGLQKVGNGKELWGQYPEVRRVFGIASEVGGFDVAELSFEGPEDLLNRTEYAQLVNATNTYVDRMVMVMQRPRLYGRPPKVGVGQSAGAADAAFWLECFGNPYLESTFRKFARYKRERGLIFQEVSDRSNGKLVVVGAVKRKREEKASLGQVNAINEIISIANQYGLEKALDVSYEQVILGGKIENIEKIIDVIGELYGGEGIRAVISKASTGPFHTSLMKDADQPCRDLVKDMALEDPKGYFVANTKKGFEVTAEGVEEDLGNLTTMPVLGKDMDALINENCRGVIYFIGGKRTVAEDMFLVSAENRRKQILSGRNIAIAAGVATIGAGGVVLGTKAIKNRNRQ